MMTARRYEPSFVNIKQYLIKAQRRIDSAQDLLKMGHFNEAISRAYYAFFDAAQAALLSKKLFAKTHRGVEILFSKHFIDSGEFPKEIGRWLGRAREAREEVDYNLWKEYSKEQAEAAIKAAKKFVQEVQKRI